MTDGEWQDCRAGHLASYREEGRIIIGCGFSSGYGSAEPAGDNLRRYGCDETYGIANLMDMPKLLEQTLVAMV